MKICFFRYITGDCLFLAEICGCQTASSNKPCFFCKLERAAFGTIETGEPRSIESLKRDGDRALRGIAKRDCNSVKHPPFITAIPLENVVPPPLHLCMAIVNKAIETFKDDEE